MHFLAPVIPIAANEVFTRLGTPPVIARNLRTDFYNLKAGTPVTVGEILFQKIELGDDVAAAKAAELAAAEAKKTKAGGGGGGKNKKGAEAEIPEDPNQVDFTKMDFRVGKITKVWHHETASRLFCEEIDCGEDAPRQVASGLREYYTLDQMEGRKVIVICNLKETKLQGFMSFGMVLAAKVETEVEDATAEGGVSKKVRIELLEPPADAQIGERVYLEGLKEGEVGGGPALPAARIKKLKVCTY
jgi:methionine--tRNA ligase beta chain